MTCRGCGVTYEYATATIEFEREVEFEPVTVRRAPDAGAAAPPPPPPPPPQSSNPIPAIAAGAPPADETRIDTAPELDIGGAYPRQAQAPPKKARGGEKKSSRDRLVIAGLLILSAAAFAFAVIRVTGQNSEESSSATTPAAVNPAPDKPSQPTAKPEPQPATPKPQNDQRPPQGKSKVESTTVPGPGEKVVKTERFSVIVPSGWQQRDAAGGSLLSPPGGSPVSVQVFYENEPGMTKQVLAAQTADFLRSRDPGAKVGAVKSKSIASNPGFELPAVGAAGSQVALGVLAGPYRYLVIESADPNAPTSTRKQADRALESFQPR